MTMNIGHEKLIKLKLLSELVWDGKADYNEVISWIDGLKNNIDINEDDVCNLIYALEHFIYFNSMLIDSLLKAMYRDLYQYDIIYETRRMNKNTLDEQFIENSLSAERLKTRFIGVGGAGESGSYLLYLFRTKNSLGSDLFLNASEILKSEQGPPQLKEPCISRYIFIDDFCGTGDQCEKYLKPITQKIKEANRGILISYMCLAGTRDGLENVRREVPSIDKVQTLIELDNSFKIFDQTSRYYLSTHTSHLSNVNQEYFKGLCDRFADKLGLPSDMRYGHKNCQLLIAFQHNTPDNSLPIFWYASDDSSLAPVFKRQIKQYEGTP